MTLSEPKWSTPGNEAYSAAVFELDMNKSYALDGLDNLVGYRVMGYQALIPKDYESGLYLMFPPETQLSNDYASNNNLFRHSTADIAPHLNSLDPTIILNITLRLRIHI